MYKIFFSFFFILTGLLSKAQFGFERIDTIDVYKDALLQKFPWAGGLDYVQISNIDLNYDGVQDLFVFDRTCNKILTFLQTGGVGEMNYVYAPHYESAFPKMQNWALLVDYNCDGKNDIFTYTIGGGKVYKNVGNASSGLQFELVKANLRSSLYGNATHSFMYISSIDIPAIVDIDGDGDLDILAFGVGGTSVEYHRNMSVELYGNCDSLFYERKNVCWGRFKESASSNDVLLDQPCPGNEASPQMEIYDRPIEEQDRHAGSNVLVLDLDGDGVMDAVLGDISHTNLVKLTNGGTVPNTNSAMVSVDYAFPSNSVPVDLKVFPAGFYVDINNDNIRDLIVSPASTIGAENVNSVWLYENTSVDNHPVFEYVKDNFLQEDMIDWGSGSYPIFFDQNGDGLKDLLVSTQGRFDPVSGNPLSKIAYYENTGTLLYPEFTFVTDNWQNLSVHGIGNQLNFYPTFGDLDGDGDEDMILGEYGGNLYYFQNTGGAGNPAIFNTFILLQDNTGTLIYDGTFPIPHLVDLDRDGDMDLVIGKRNGKLNYFENTGSTSSYSFTLKTNNLGGVDVSEYWTTEGRAVPQFIDIDGEYHLILGSKSGFLHYYNDIDDNITGNFHFVDSTLQDINIGDQSAPAIYDISGNNRLEMALGNMRGGLALYSSAPISNVGIKENTSEVNWKIYPNPNQGIFQVQISSLNKVDLENGKIQIRDISGRILYQKYSLQENQTLYLNDLANGVYFVTLFIENKAYTNKIIIE